MKKSNLIQHKANSARLFPSFHIPAFQVPATCRNVKIPQKLDPSNSKKELGVLRAQEAPLAWNEGVFIKHHHCSRCWSCSEGVNLLTFPSSSHNYFRHVNLTHSFFPSQQGELKSQEVGFFKKRSKM